LSTFNEVLAAGTAAALVPIKSITCNSRNETSSYIAADSDEPGPVCVKLLTTLKGIQAGKIKDTFNWNSKVEEMDIKKYTTAEHIDGANGESVNKLP
jgi:branched-chain amino acid aminotransferase